MTVELPPTETGELAAFADMWAAAPSDVQARLGLASLTVDGALVFSCAVAPIRELNRAVGVTTTSELDGAEQFFRRIDGPYWVSLLPGTGLDEELARRGYERDYGWMKFDRLAGSAAPAPTELRLEEVGRDRATDFAETACTGYGLGAEFVPWVEQLPGRDGWICTVAYDGDAPVGAGALYVEGDVGWLGFGATLPDARGRGSQSAILAHRIDRAADLGCRLVVTETGALTEGRVSGSYRNIVRADFAEGYVRPNYRAP